MTAEQHADTVRRHYAKVCSCEWEDLGYDEVISEVNEACIIHGSQAIDPLDALLAENQRLRDALLDVLDVCTGWTRKMTVAEKLDAIEQVAREALRGGDAA